MKTAKNVKDEVVHNNTPFTKDEIDSMAKIAHIRNNWRQRNVSVYQHPYHTDTVITKGVSFDGTSVVLCIEEKSLYEKHLGNFNAVFN